MSEEIVTRVNFSKLERWEQMAIIFSLPDNKSESFKRISEGTQADPDREMTITMQINGVPVNALAVFDRYRQAFHAEVLEEAKRMVDDYLALMDAEDIIADTFREARETIKAKFAEKGLVWSSED